MRVWLLTVVLLIALSAAANAAGPSGNDTYGSSTYPYQQTGPAQYNQEDSHPLRIIGYILSPVGVALEYTIARPLHYLATQTFLQPVLDPGLEQESWEEFYGTGSVPPALIQPRAEPLQPHLARPPAVTPQAGKVVPKQSLPPVTQPVLH